MHTKLDPIDYKKIQLTTIVYLQGATGAMALPL